MPLLGFWTFFSLTDTKTRVKTKVLQKKEIQTTRVGLFCGGSLQRFAGLSSEKNLLLSLVTQRKQRMNSAIVVRSSTN